ncbi:MAG: hypothetical protein RL477_2106 [Pseudomonadota bacterium]|jgi:hypothetical protein
MTRTPPEDSITMRVPSGSRWMTVTPFGPTIVVSPGLRKMIDWLPSRLVTTREVALADDDVDVAEAVEDEEDDPEAYEDDAWPPQVGQ